MDSLTVALPVFFACAVVVVIAGINLAKYGDAIAESTGWGALWVGTVLVSVATSLPELITNITAVLIGAPGLALGNVFGADMINMFTLSLVALIFGARQIFSGQARDTQLLVLITIGMAVIALVVGSVGDVGFANLSIGGLLIAAAYLGGMRLVYAAGRGTDTGTTDADAVDIDEGTADGRKVWIGFSAASAAIVVASIFLARSADGIADATGLSEGFIGVLAVSIVTTLPEATVTFAAALRKSYGIAMGNMFGSNAFNLFVIPIAGLFHGEPLLNSMGPEHFAAVGTAIALMSLAFLVLYSYQTRVLRWMKAFVPVIVVAYPIALFWVLQLG